MRILITGGPTNEYIDEVMKITNMSKGSLSKSLANDLARRGHEVLLLLNDGVNPDNIDKWFNISLLSYCPCISASFPARAETSVSVTISPSILQIGRAHV